MIRIIFAVLSPFFLCSCLKSDKSFEIVARIDGEIISSKKVDDLISDHIYKSLFEIYENRRIALNEILNERVIQNEIKARQIDRDSLFKLEVGLKIPKINIDSFVSVNGLRNGIPSPKNSLKYLSIDSKEGFQELMSAIEIKLTDDFIDRLKVKYKVDILLKAPKMPMKNLTGIKKESRGDLSSEITFTLVTNIDCPACVYHQPFFDSLYSAYSDKAKIEFINIADLSSLKSLLSEYAFLKGKYWEFVQACSSNDVEADSSKIYSIYKSFVSENYDDIDLEIVRVGVDKRKEFLMNIGIQTTPTILINGRIYFGRYDIQSISRFMMDEGLLK